jgi:phosphoglycerate dehydrogenase-like enzyme
MSHKVIFTTERGDRHQRAALQAAPAALDITILRAPDHPTLIRHLSTAAYLISERRGTVSAEIIEGAPKLKLIQRLGSLTYDINTEAARAAGVAVCYWPVQSTVRVAEHVVMQMLALVKKLNEVQRIAQNASTDWRTSQRTDEDTFAYNWSNRTEIGGLAGKHIGIVGFGEIGAELARRLRSWDVTVRYNKRTPFPDTVERELNITHASKDDLLDQSDILVNLLPYSAQTDQLIDATWFDALPQGAFLVSAGSGSVIDEAALATAITIGQVAGAALDTYEWEPLRPDNPLLALVDNYNLLLTPHTAAGTDDANQQERSDQYTNILRHINGDPLRYRIV